MHMTCQGNEKSICLTLVRRLRNQRPHERETESESFRQNGHMNAEATKQVINDIKKPLIEASRRKEKQPDASLLEYETVDINLPLERPLTLTSCERNCV